jgi:hypothetical protein
MAGYSSPLHFYEISNWFQGALGFNGTMANLVTVMFILIIYLMPLVFMKVHSIIMLHISILLLTVFTAVGWLDSWTWIILGIYVAYIVSDKMKGWF